MNSEKIEHLAKLIRYYCIISTTEAGSGHLTSSLSAVDLMVVLFFGGHFRFALDNPNFPNNDRIIFSKGHASPLFYSLYAAAGRVSNQDLLQFRKFSSPLEGHPTRRFPYTEVATGSLGQGLSIGVGMALNAKYLDKLPYNTYVLLGDSEMAEGSVWEAMQLASFYKLDNLIGIIDVNRLGQRGETMYGHNLKAYQDRCQSFGWKTIVIDGHNYKEINQAFIDAHKYSEGPVMIIAETIKGKGISFLEDQEDWHGKVLDNKQAEKAIRELGEIYYSLRGEIVPPEDIIPLQKAKEPEIELDNNYKESLSTREAYGHALVEMGEKYPNLVVLDAEVSNSTYSELFKQRYPERFFEMFIAEQNMVGVAVGLAARGKLPFVSTFSAFFTRAFDQIRVAQYSQVNIKFVGSHAGVSVGADGPTQMGLEDMAMFRSILNSVVLYPADHVAAEKLVKLAAEESGICYIRTTRDKTNPIYEADEDFVIGGSKVLRQSAIDEITVITAGITLYEVLKAYEELEKQGIMIRVIDLYSVKPVDIRTLEKAVQETKALLTIEDHYPAGGLGEAVRSALDGISKPIYSLAVNKLPRSGTAEELINYEDISSASIINKIKEII